MTDAFAADFPLRLYEYNAEGRYGYPLRIENSAALEVAMTTIVKAALAERREVRITDTGDDLVFHVQNGSIVWPTEADIRNGEES